MKRHNHKPVWKHWGLTTSKWDTHCPPPQDVFVCFCPRSCCITCRPQSQPKPGLRRFRCGAWWWRFAWHSGRHRPGLCPSYRVPGCGQDGRRDWRHAATAAATTDTHQAASQAAFSSTRYQKEKKPPVHLFSLSPEHKEMTQIAYTKPVLRWAHTMTTVH